MPNRGSLAERRGEGSFKNYVDQSLPNLDHPIDWKVVGILHTTLPSLCYVHVEKRALSTGHLPTFSFPSSY